MTSAYSDKAILLDGLVSSAGRVCAVVHSHPDGDALGSGAAFCRFVTGRYGKECRLVVPDACPDTLDFVYGGVDFVDASADRDAALAAIASADLIACLDMNAFDRAGVLEAPLGGSGAKKVLIDHHQNPDSASFDLVVSETEVSSASELLYKLLLGLPDVGSAADLPDGCGDALMVGMTTDTNNFANSVYPSTLAMASDLLASGVDRDWLLSMIYNRYRENRVRAMGRFLDMKLKISGGGVAYMVIRKEDIREFDLKEGDTEGFVNIPLTIDGVRLSLFLKEDDGFFRVSVRSRRGTSASGLARGYFHGGGHECASGGRLFFPEDIPSRDEAEEYIEKVTARFLQMEDVAKQR